MSFHIVGGTERYTTSTTNMYNKNVPTLLVSATPFQRSVPAPRGIDPPPPYLQHVEKNYIFGGGKKKYIFGKTKQVPKKVKTIRLYGPIHGTMMDSEQQTYRQRCSALAARLNLVVRG